MDDDRLDLLRELEIWDGATSARRRAVAKRVADGLPGSFVFDGLATHALGGQSHEFAFFKHGESTFALVPGCSDAVLGYDRSRPFVPTEAQQEDWIEVQEEFGVEMVDHLDECLGPLRRATISPMLMETVARKLRYGRSGDGRLEGLARVREFCGEGFRIPTVDEWEFACAGGTRTLFRWGDDCPLANSYRDKAFKLHKQPNAFGLTMNSSTYDSEICDGPAFRGGDGGASVCGGVGNLITWFPFASSFRVPDEVFGDWHLSDVFVRRVRPLVA